MPDRPLPNRETLFVDSVYLIALESLRDNWRGAALSAGPFP